MDIQRGRFRAFQAGGNMQGDCDQLGRPVVEGRWYVAGSPEPPEEGLDPTVYTVAGPFASEGMARTIANDMERYEGYTRRA